MHDTEHETDLTIRLQGATTQKNHQPKKFRWY